MTILKQCIGQADIASTIARYPVLPDDCVRCVLGMFCDLLDCLQYFVTTEKYSMGVVGLKIAGFSRQWLLLLLDMFLLVTLCLST